MVYTGTEDARTGTTTLVPTCATLNKAKNASVDSTQRIGTYTGRFGLLLVELNIILMAMLQGSPSALG